MKYLAFGLAAVVYDHFGLVAAVFFALMGIDIIFQWMRGQHEHHPRTYRSSLRRRS